LRNPRDRDLYRQLLRGHLSRTAQEAAAETAALRRTHPRTGLRKHTFKRYLRRIGWRLPDGPGA